MIRLRVYMRINTYATDGYCFDVEPVVEADGTCWKDRDEDYKALRDIEVNEADSNQWLVQQGLLQCEEQLKDVEEAYHRAKGQVAEARSKYIMLTHQPV